MDARIAALAKLVRSDSESLARRIVADQEATKQALRAMEGLQASLPADVIETVQRRMDDLAESVAKSQEMLAQRVDRMAAKIGEQHDNDIQVVVDRMGDAMHASRAWAGHRSETRTATGSTSSRAQASQTSASPRRIGLSVRPSRSSVTHRSRTARRASASTERTDPPATIVSPISTGARNCARSRATPSASPSHPVTHDAMWAIM